MPSVRIDDLRTMNQDHVNATLFNPFGDALALVMDVSASADLLALPDPMFQAVFQILDPLSDTVVINETWLHDFAWGPFFWISMGNNWGPSVSDYTTPEDWGLDWTPEGGGVFGFRGIIKAYSWQGENGLQTIDAFDVSGIRWFRVREIFRV